MAKQVNVDKVQEIHARLLAERKEAIEIALLDKGRIVQERLLEQEQRIAIEVEQELTAKASEPYASDIALIESFLEEPQQETEAEAEETQEVEASEQESELEVE